MCGATTFLPTLLGAFLASLLGLVAFAVQLWISRRTARKDFRDANLGTLAWISQNLKLITEPYKKIQVVSDDLLERMVLNLQARDMTLGPEFAVLSVAEKLWFSELVSQTMFRLSLLKQFLKWRDAAPGTPEKDAFEQTIGEHVASLGDLRDTINEELRRHGRAPMQ